MNELTVTRLVGGKVGTPREDGTGGCVMAWVNVYDRLAQGWSLSDALTDPSDSPACTEPLVRSAAIRVNDRLNDVDRQRLIDRIPRLMAASTPSDPLVARRCRVRVACWAARSVLHLVRVEDREVCEQAIVTAERWLAGDATEQELRRDAYAAASASAAASAADAAAYAAASASADAAAATAYASAAAYAAAAAADAAAYAAYAADAAAYAAADAAEGAASAAAAAASAADAAEGDLVDLLDDLLDQWSKAKAEEGVMCD